MRTAQKYLETAGLDRQAFLYLLREAIPVQE